VHKLPNKTRACIHFGSHNHFVLSGDCHELITITKELVRHEMEKNLGATTSTIVLAASKRFLNHELFVSHETTIMKL
jgi:RNA polymerase-interacting CarD/CdnL/TRCF family regulator